MRTGGGGGGGGGGQGKAEPRCLKGQSTLQLSVMPKIKLGRGAGQGDGRDNMKSILFSFFIFFKFCFMPCQILSLHFNLL